MFHHDNRRFPREAVWPSENVDIGNDIANNADFFSLKGFNEFYMAWLQKFPPV
jgi:hypothetical protein